MAMKAVGTKPRINIRDQPGPCMAGCCQPPFGPAHQLAADAAAMVLGQHTDDPSFTGGLLCDAEANHTGGVFT